MQETLDRPNPKPDLNPAAVSETRTGAQLPFEKWLERHVGNWIHLFLSLLALLIFSAAVITTGDVVIRGFPQLWRQSDEYSVLQDILLTMLLIAIAAELGLLLLFHRTTAAVEVIIFIIARKLVSPETTLPGLLLGVAAIIGLVITRFYFLPGRVK
jgi:hypothetical protein